MKFYLDISGNGETLIELSEEVFLNAAEDAEATHVDSDWTVKFYGPDKYETAFLVLMPR